MSDRINGFTVTFTDSVGDEYTQHPAIKQAIESVLNNDTVEDKQACKKIEMLTAQHGYDQSLFNQLRAP